MRLSFVFIVGAREGTVTIDDVAMPICSAVQVRSSRELCMTNMPSSLENQASKGNIESQENKCLSMLLVTPA